MCWEERGFFLSVFICFWIGGRGSEIFNLRSKTGTCNGTKHSFLNCAQNRGPRVPTFSVPNSISFTGKKRRIVIYIHAHRRTQTHKHTHTLNILVFPLAALQSLYCRIITVSEKKALNKAKVRLLRLGICCDNKSEMIASYRFMNFLPPQSQTSDVYFIKKAFRFFLQFP